MIQPGDDWSGPPMAVVREGRGGVQWAVAQAAAGVLLGGCCTQQPLNKLCHVDERRVLDLCTRPALPAAAEQG